MAAPIKNTSTSEISSTLMKEIIYRYGRPILIKSDNAAYLNNAAIEQICKSAGVKLYYGRPYIHTSQSLVKRAFLSLKNVISKIVNFDSQPQWKHWDDCLNLAIHFYNNLPQMTLKFSPYELFFETEPYLDFHTIVEQCDKKLVDRERQF
uniref:Integrase catalytic domain-containing protein n=1 Tax=Strongyloides venezuelensis TaxID=75913 RepID=A0A0K0FFV9_STRVS